jgi:hypothetical protein
MRLIISGTSGDMWGYLEPGTADEITALERSVAQGEWTIGRGDESITGLRALAERLGYRAIEVHEPPTTAPLRQVVVQRGQTALAERLRARVPPSVPVISDRRTRDRRASAHSTTDDRRRRDRRRTPPPMWAVLGFLVVPREETPS